ncbi:MAG: hypothetical protein WC983_11280 [Tissierellaceae bacterium]
MKITSKEFVGFFKKEFNINFIDAKTGKNVLEIIKENEKKKNCLNCYWSMSGDGVYLHKEDTICINDKSEYVTDWMSDEIVCEFWEKDGEKAD